MFFFRSKTLAPPQRLGAAALSYGLPIAAAGAAYAQPVIYIHPESLSTSYPLQALGLPGITGYSVSSSAYTSALESLYSPYGTNSQSSRNGKSRLKFFFHSFVSFSLGLSYLQAVEYINNNKEFLYVFKILSSTKAKQIFLYEEIM